MIKALILCYWLIFTLACSEQSNKLQSYNEGLVFFDYSATPSIFSTLTTKLSYIEFIRDDNQVFRFAVNKELDWGLIKPLYLSALNVPEADYSSIRLYLDLENTKALIYGENDNGEQLPATWLAPQLSDSHGSLIPQQQKVKVLSLSLSRPLQVTKGRTSLLRLELSANDSVTPVQRNQDTVLLFDPAINIIEGTATALMGKILRWEENILTVDINGNHIPINNPQWHINGFAVEGAGNAAALIDKNVLFNAGKNEQGHLQIDQVNVITKEHYIGQITPSPDGVNFMGHRLDSDKGAIYTNFNFAAPNEGNTTQIDPTKLLPGQIVELYLSDKQDHAEGTEIILHNTPVIGEIFLDNDKNIHCRPITINGKHANGFYAGSFLMDEDFKQKINEGEIKESDILFLNANFTKPDNIHIDVFDYRHLSNTKVSHSAESSITLKWHFNLNEGIQKQSNSDLLIATSGETLGFSSQLSGTGVSQSLHIKQLLLEESTNFTLYTESGALQHIENLPDVTAMITRLGNIGATKNISRLEIQGKLENFIFKAKTLKFFSDSLISNKPESIVSPKDRFQLLLNNEKLFLRSLDTDKKDYEVSLSTTQPSGHISILAHQLKVFPAKLSSTPSLTEKNILSPIAQAALSPQLSEIKDSQSFLLKGPKLDPSTRWERASDSVSSQEGGLFLEKTTQTIWYVKYGTDQSTANEAFAAKLYNALGITTPIYENFSLTEFEQNTFQTGYDHAVRSSWNTEFTDLDLRHTDPRLGEGKDSQNPEFQERIKIIDGSRSEILTIAIANALLNNHDCGVNVSFNNLMYDNLAPIPSPKITLSRAFI